MFGNATEVFNVCNLKKITGHVPGIEFFFVVSELVLKVRIQNPNARENDFIEVELDRQELTYRALLRVCCRELDISAEHVEKIRKLPNTMLRKVWDSRHTSTNTCITILTHIYETLKECVFYLLSCLCVHNASGLR